MKLWLRRFNPRNWVQISTEEAQCHPYYGLRGRILYILIGLFFLSSLTLAIEWGFSVEHGDLHQNHYDSTVIFFISLSLAYGVFTKRWWTRYLSYVMFALTLGNLLLHYGISENFVGAASMSAAEYFWWALVLLLMRDLPLCLYLTLSRRARMTLERQAFCFDKYFDQHYQKAG